MANCYSKVPNTTCVAFRTLPGAVDNSDILIFKFPNRRLILVGLSHSHYWLIISTPSFYFMMSFFSLSISYHLLHLLSSSDDLLSQSQPPPPCCVSPLSTHFTFSVSLPLLCKWPGSFLNILGITSRDNWRGGILIILLRRNYVKTVSIVWSFCFQYFLE